MWIEGKCRQYRIAEDTKERVQRSEKRGWLLLGECEQSTFLGVSVSEALPQFHESKEDLRCEAEKVWKDGSEAACSEKDAKKARTEY